MTDLSEIMLDHDVTMALAGDLESALRVQEALHAVTKARQPLSEPLRRYLEDASGSFLSRVSAANNPAKIFAKSYGLMKPQGRQQSDLDTEYQIARFVVEMKQSTELTMEEIYSRYQTSDLAKDLKKHLSIQNFQRIYDKRKNLVKQVTEINDRERDS